MQIRTNCFLITCGYCAKSAPNGLPASEHLQLSEILQLLELQSSLAAEATKKVSAHSMNTLILTDITFKTVMTRFRSH